MTRPILAALLMFAAGLAVADDHVIPVGQFADLKYKVSKGDILKLRVSPAPLQRADGLEPGRLIFAGEAGKTYTVRGYLVNFDKKTFDEVDDTVTFGGKAEPKPGPGPEPEPKPNPKPEPGPPPGQLFIVVVEETSARTPEIARVLSDVTFWGGLDARGVQWRLYDKDAPDAVRLRYTANAVAAGLPAVLVLGADGRVWDRRRLTTTADIDAVLRRYGR